MMLSLGAQLPDYLPMLFSHAWTSCNWHHFLRSDSSDSTYGDAQKIKSCSWTVFDKCVVFYHQELITWKINHCDTIFDIVCLGHVQQQTVIGWSILDGSVQNGNSIVIYSDPWKDKKTRQTKKKRKNKRTDEENQVVAL